MFDFIPLQYYTTTFYTTMFIISLCLLVFTLGANIQDRSSRVTLNYIGFLSFFGLVLYMGLRPVSGVFFGDMITYSQTFNKIKSGIDIGSTKDVLFDNFMKFCAQIMDEKSFFTLVDFMYILPCLLFARKYSGSFWFFTFFLFIASFSFWSYGTNGIRNGLATSIFILSLVFYNKKILMYGLMALSYGIHSSLVIPIAAFITSGIIKNAKIYIYIWLAAIPLSLFAGGSLQIIFAGLFSDARATDYLTRGNYGNDAFSSTGFRWDFVAYSAAAVYAGWWYIIKREITDRFYIHMYGTYVIANAFWILIIKANFSNRFAYLSWFLMAAVIAYPVFRYKLWNNQYRAAGLILMAYYGFTYFMFLKT